YSNVWVAHSVGRPSREKLENADTLWLPFLYVYTNTTYAQMKSFWATCNLNRPVPRSDTGVDGTPPDSLCIGSMTIAEFAAGDGDGDAIPYIRPAVLQDLERHDFQNDAAEQFSLGRMYHEGDSVIQDFVKAARWYQKAADQGHALAQFNLGHQYRCGLGVPRDPAEAVKWYRKAADQGCADAQVNLGLAYSTGQGVPQDYVQALKWYRDAANQGDSAAQRDLDDMDNKGRAWGSGLERHCWRFPQSLASKWARF